MENYPSIDNETNGWDSLFNTVDQLEPLDELFSIDHIEHMLMNDNNNNNNVENLNEVSNDITDDFFADLFLDLPVVEEEGKNSSSNSNSSVNELVDDGKKSNSSSSDNGLIEGDDMDKKQLRQIRNRDAAVRSRERKKMYVKELEMKSRYFEGECKRLGMLLQCCSAENQALRLSMQNGKTFDASMTKQESAVLIMESLLLGSLLWFLGVVCLFNLPKPTPLPENVGDRVQGSLVLPRKPLNHDENFNIRTSPLFIMSRRCKSSRSRIKPSSPSLGVLFDRKFCSLWL